MTPELTVIVPTRNERTNVVPLFTRLERALCAIRWEVIFVDDNSPDRTADAVRGLAAQDARVRLIERHGQRGLASACVTGMVAAAAPYVAVVDADLQHDVAQLPAMLRTLRDEHIDVVVASRYVQGASTRGFPQQRARLSRLAVRLAHCFPRAALADPMSGFFVLRHEAFDAALPHLSQHGFKILFDILLSAPRPLTWREIPCEFGMRQRGASKLDALAALEFLVLLLDKLTGRLIPMRLVSFLCVGGSGVAVHFAALYALLTAGVSFIAAQTAAVLAAMTSNFTLNNLITYRDQRLSGWRWLRGLLSFYAVCAVGAVANVSLATLIYRRTGIWWLAGGIGAALGAAWNYIASRSLTWGGSTRAGGSE